MVFDLCVHFVLQCENQIFYTRKQTRSVGAPRPISDGRNELTISLTVGTGEIGWDRKSRNKYCITRSRTAAND
jgi:hypothetical protein